jgi:hypothetical protein
MICDVEITAEDFKEIHNGLYELRAAMEQLEDVVNPKLFSRLNKGTEMIRNGLAGAYRQEQESFKTKSQHYEQVQSRIGARAVWSMYEISDLNAQHPFRGATAVVYGNHWGDKPAQALIDGDTWADVYRAADIAIKRSGDGHHVYIESLALSKDDPTKLVLGTGS